MTSDPPRRPAPLARESITTASSSPVTLQNADSLRTLEEAEREHIRAALQAAQGRRAGPAKILGISEAKSVRKLHEYDLPR